MPAVLEISFLAQSEKSATDVSVSHWQRVKAVTEDLIMANIGM